MKKIILIAILSLSISSLVNAQSTDDAKKATDAAAASLNNKKADLKDGWTKGGTFNLTINEAGMNTAWQQTKGGDIQALGIRALVDYSFDRKKGKTNWLNLVRARYGVQRASSTDNKFQKNDDFFAFNSTYGKEFRKSWSYAGFFSLETQFDQFLTPGSIKLGPGLLYKPNAHFNLLVSPLLTNITTKLAKDLKNVNAFGVDSGKVADFGLGAFAQANINYDIAKGVNYKAVATAYSNYLNKPGNVIFDVNNLFTLTVNKYLGATVMLNMRYNDFEVSRTQLQHAIGVGLSYKL
jgi:hypothetical protein